MNGLTAKGLVLKGGTIVDATIISKSTSTRNAAKERDPEMYQTRKRREWYFGMKVHVGTHTQGFVHSLVTSAANVADVTMLPELLHGDERALYGDKA